jgi:hypothetical protein
MLIPAPMSQMHTGFIRTYINTGREKILGRIVHQMALHKNKR